jgi:hypothetical protein
LRLNNRHQPLERRKIACESLQIHPTALRKIEQDENLASLVPPVAAVFKRTVFENKKSAPAFVPTGNHAGAVFLRLYRRKQPLKRFAKSLAIREPIIGAEKR